MKLHEFLLVFIVFLLILLPIANSFSEVRERVIIVPPKTGIHKMSMMEISHVKKLRTIDAYVVYVGKDEKKRLEKLGYKIYRDIPVKAYLVDSVPQIEADKVWKLHGYGHNITGFNISVCVLDTGVDYTHPDLGGCFGNGTNYSCKVVAGYDFVNGDSDPMDDEGHGTHVAGIIAANGTLKGVAPDAKIVAVKVLDNTGSGFISDIIDGINWCVENAEKYNIKVISMSLGSYSTNSTYCDSYYPPLTEAIDNAVGKNISVVIATGNSYSYDGVSFPACVYNATRVTSVDKTDYFASYANRGGVFDIILAAPGNNINSTYIGGTYRVESGTSMATPHVSGTIALIRQVEKNLTPKEIERILNNTGIPLYDSQSNRTYSRIDAYSAILYVYPHVEDIKISKFYVHRGENFTINATWYSKIDNNPDLYVDVNSTVVKMLKENISDNNATDGIRYYAVLNLDNYGFYRFKIFSNGTTDFVSEYYEGPWVADYFWVNSTSYLYDSNYSNCFIISNSSEILAQNFTLNNCTIHKLRDFNFTIRGPGDIIDVNISNIVLDLENGNFTIGGNVTGDFNISIIDTNISKLYLKSYNSTLFVQNKTFDYGYFYGTNKIKGFYSLGGIIVNGTFVKYFPIEIVKDVNRTYVAKNTTFIDENYTNVTFYIDGFSWIPLNFSGNESYKMFVEGFGFANKNGTSAIFRGVDNITNNFTFDVEVPKIFNFTVNRRYISENISAVINFLESEPLMRRCLIINNTNNSFVLCNSSTIYFSTVYDGNYSVYSYISDFNNNTNITYMDWVVVDNKRPEIFVDYTPVVINGSEIFVNISIAENYLNYSLLNISGPENFSYTFYGNLTFPVKFNYTGIYNFTIKARDLSENEITKRFSIVSTKPKIINISVSTPFNLSLRFEYVKSINETKIENKTEIIIPEWVYNVTVDIENLFETKLLNVNVSLVNETNFNFSLSDIGSFLKTYAFDTNMNFSNATVELNYNFTNYTNDDYLSVYRCDNWSFENNSCLSGWYRISFEINKTGKYVKFFTPHFSAFAVNQEPYCGDGIKNQASEECDGSDFGGKTCSDFGYNSGTLQCTSDCKIDTSNCYNVHTSSSSGSSSSFVVIKKQTCKNISQTCSSNNECCSGYCYNGICENKIINYVLICPKYLEFNNTNISFVLKIKNSGNYFGFGKVWGNGINKTLYLYPNETKSLKVNLELFEGTYNFRYYTQNDSCKIVVNITIPRKEEIVNKTIEQSVKNKQGLMKEFVEILKNNYHYLLALAGLAIVVYIFRIYIGNEKRKIWKEVKQIEKKYGDKYEEEIKIIKKALDKDAVTLAKMYLKDLKEKIK